jgi:hypothetical protein
MKDSSPQCRIRHRNDMIRGALAPLLVAALLSSANGYAQTQPARAQVGPLQAWVARGASGACQLQLRNVGDTAVVAWTVTVHSEDAHYISVFRHDGWRDAFHLPSASLHVPPGETRSFTVGEDGAIGDLTVRIHLLVLANDLAHGMAEYAAHVGGADDELRGLQDRRRGQAVQALAVAEKIDEAVRQQGAAQVLASKLASSVLETDGDWNWWRITEAVKAAEALPAGDPKAPADLSAALDLLREAHRQGTAAVTLRAVEPMHPVVVGSCVG